MKNILNNLETELNQRQKKYQKDLKIFDVSILTISFGTLILKILFDTQIYLYENYLVYSAIFFALICIFLCYFLSKFFILSRWYYLSGFIFNITISLWLIPKIMHYSFMESSNICFNATIQNKYWHRPGDMGYVKLKIDYNSSIPEKILYSKSFFKLSYDDYNRLPKSGTHISICGKLSKVGFTYTEIKKIK